jgi:hypothetical protein
MSFLFSGLFWGVVLILLGISVIINIFFKVHIPFFRIIIALFFVYIGLTILLGGSRRLYNGQNIIFGESIIESIRSKATHNIIFGKGIIDLNKFELQDKDNRIEINVIFGGGVVKLNPDIPTVVKTDTVFGGVRMPDGNTTAFGSYLYKTKNVTNEQENHLVIKAAVIFGSLDIFD